MKRACALALALWTTSVVAATVDVKVYDAFGQSYRTVDIGEQLGAIYNISFDPTLVLVLGPSLSDERVEKQERIVSGINPAEYGILLAIGTPTESYSRGFSVAPNTATSLMPSQDAFRVIVLGADGTVLQESSKVLSRERLIELSPASR